MSSPLFSGPRHRPRQRILEAVLQVSGELGYEQVAVKDIIERARSSRATFYKHFEDRQDCFALAHREAAEWLFQRLIATARRHDSWCGGVQAGLAGLLEFCARQPTIAKALFVEVHAAGGRALEQRNRLMEGFARAVDSARREIPTDQGPPLATANFIVGAIDTLVCGKLVDGDAASAPAMLPDILYFVVMHYFGEDAAPEEISAGVPTDLAPETV